MPLAALGVATAVWLWPLGVGGRMPVGGDVTSFQIGLMAEYQRALRSWRLPLWNDNWGLGFPGLAESQMGVYYPPHVVLYGLLPLEAAYTASLVLHTFWGALGAFWCARKFGVTPWGSALAAFAWSGGGFFVIHATHQWAYTAGSWMPWAWGLAWSVGYAPSGRRAWLWLAAILAIQVLPGHFQLAFITQTGVFVIALWSAADRAFLTRRVDTSPSPSRRWPVLTILMAWIFAGFLAACQLRPTWDLARRAEPDRTYEYLSGFAQTPLHLVSYVAPGLFHGSPLWRPIAWDPFHTSPEECLGYVGIVPLWLALAAVAREWRKHAGVRALICLAIVSFVLSLGPYVPGFAWLIKLPGFNFFRAPARWGAASMLALALLAGVGFDRVGGWLRVRASAWRFTLFALALPLALIGVFELAFASTSGRGLPDVVGGFDAVLRLLPWNERPDVRAIMNSARQPATNPITLSALRRRGIEPDVRFDRVRAGVYVQELAVSSALLAALACCAWLWGRGAAAREEAATDHAGSRALNAALLILTGLDLVLLSRQRDVDTGPIASLLDQSPVLKRLADEARDTQGRVVSPLGNLPMVADAANIPAYRTLDVRVAPQSVGRAMLPLSSNLNLVDSVIGMFELAATLRVVPPGDPLVIPEGFETGFSTRGLSVRLEKIHDPVLARWLLGIPNPKPHESEFRVLRLTDRPGRFLLQLRSQGGRSPTEYQSLLWRRAAPEQFLVENVECQDVATLGPCTVLLLQTPDPEWRADWSNGTTSHPAPILPGDPFQRGWWDSVAVSRSGRWTLELRYSGIAAHFGLAVSSVAWALWALLWTLPRFVGPRGRGALA